jgi:phosphoglycolate phosphatase
MTRDSSLWEDIDAVVFDFDGTLANCPYDFARMRDALYAVATRHGVPRDALAALLLLEGIERGVELLGGATEAARAFRRDAEETLLELEIEDAQQARLLDGSAAALSALREAGVRVAIITRNCRQVVTGVIGDAEMPYDALLTREDVAQVKPHESHLRLALDAIDTQPERALMVGDHAIDMETGRRLAMRTVGVLTGNSTEAELLRAGADAVLPGVAEAAQLIIRARVAP